MSVDPGLTPQGFTVPTLANEVDALNALVKANVGQNLDLSPDNPLGQVLGIFASKFAELGSALGTIYDSLDPAVASGQLLANACALSGTRPQIATFSYVNGAQLSLNAGTTVPAGAIVSVAGQPQNRWVLMAPVSNTGPSAGAFPGNFQSETPGPAVANAGTLTVIDTPVAGWTGVTNPADAIEGLAADTDTSLRQKRAAELAGEGSGDLDAIVAKVRKVPEVVQAMGYQNIGLYTDTNGLPGKSFRIVVWDAGNASNAAIAQTIWTNQPAGVLSYGSTAVTITDSTGNPQTVRFDRATAVPLWVVATTTPSTLTTAQTNAVKAALAAYALATFGLSSEVVALPFQAAGIVSGVTIDVPTFQFGTAPSPTNTGNLSFGLLSIPILASTAISVNGV